MNDWIVKSEKDIVIAEYNFEGDMLEAAAFFAQQAAEKALKALILEKEGALIRTHDLTLLARRVNAPQKIVNSGAKLNPAYTTTRYPDVPGSYSKIEVKELLNLAKEVLKWVKENLSKN